MEISVKIGGPNDQPQADATINVSGCACRMDDFVLALVKFANDWKRAADTAVKQTFTNELNPDGTPKQPCGCGEKKQVK